MGNKHLATLPACLQEALSAADFRVELRLGHQVQWDATLEQMKYMPVDYTNFHLNNHLAYQQGHGGEWWDISMVIYWDNKPVALWPLSFSVKEGRSSLSSQGIPVLPPQFVKTCPGTTRKRIVKDCLNLAGEISKMAALEMWNSAESFYDVIGMSDWHAEAMVRDSECSVLHELFLDLQPDMTDIKSNFRKRYKSLITAGLRFWSLGLLISEDKEIWNEFRFLHLRVSGRQTRSDETWSNQLQDIANQNAFLVYLRNDEGVMVGGGLFYFTRDEGLYAVGAYDRSLFDKPLGHVVQFRAIEELKRRGCRWYKIGARPYHSETPMPTDKEVSIGEFKQGFASHLFPQYRLTHRVRNDETN